MSFESPAGSSTDASLHNVHTINMAVPAECEADDLSSTAGILMFALRHFMVYPKGLGKPQRSWVVLWSICYPSRIAGNETQDISTYRHLRRTSSVFAAWLGVRIKCCFCSMGVEPFVRFARDGGMRQRSSLVQCLCGGDRSLHHLHAFCLHCDYIEYEAEIAVQQWNEQYITEHQDGYWSD